MRNGGAALAAPFAVSLELMLNESKARETSAGDPFEARAIDAVLGGDPHAYDYLVEKYMRRAVSIAWGIVRNAEDAEDLAQEAFVRAYEKIGKFRRGEPFGPWLFRIVTNLALDVAKHRRKFRHEEIGEDQQSPASSDLLASSSEIATRVDRAIESLPEMQRLVARLYLVEEFSHSEIASITNLSEGTVRSHLSHARKLLQQQLRDLYGGES